MTTRAARQGRHLSEPILDKNATTTSTQALWCPPSPRAGAILEVLRRERWDSRQARSSSLAGSASRSRRSPTSAMPWPTSAWSGAPSGRASRWAGSWPSSAGHISRPSTRIRSSTRRAGCCRPAPRRPSELAVLDGVEMTYLARHDGQQPVRLTSQIGRRLPATVTATGRAALASLDPRDLEQQLRGSAIRRSSPPVRTAPSTSLRADLIEVRRRGYAMDGEETVEGVVCFGVMIRAGRRARVRTRRASRCSRCGLPRSACRRSSRTSTCSPTVVGPLHVAPPAAAEARAQKR